VRTYRDSDPRVPPPVMGPVKEWVMGWVTVGVQWRGLYQTEPQPTSRGGGCCPVCAVWLGGILQPTASLPTRDSLVALRGEADWAGDR
jgi:hypothetical protein